MGYSVKYIDSALDILDDNSSWNFLSDALRLRVRGYRREYGENVLPLSKDDFFSTQILIYKEGELLCTYKFTREDLCTRYKVKFPLVAALEEGQIFEYTNLIQGIINEAHKKSRLLSYCGGWTIDPRARMDKESSITLRELTVATHYDYLKRFGVDEAIICGVIKFKADQLQESMGYKRIQMNGKDVGPVGLAYLDFEPVHMFHITQHNEAADRIFNKHRDILDAASVFQKPVETLIKKAA